MVGQPPEDDVHCQERYPLRQKPEEEHLAPPEGKHRDSRLQLHVEPNGQEEPHVDLTQLGQFAVKGEVESRIALEYFDASHPRRAEGQEQACSQDTEVAGQPRHQGAAQEQRVGVLPFEIGKLVMCHVFPPMLPVPEAQGATARVGHNVLNDGVDPWSLSGLGAAGQVVVHALVEGHIEVVEHGPDAEYRLPVCQVSHQRGSDYHNVQGDHQHPVQEDVPAEAEGLVLDHHLAL
mmetsp:Transcript_55252/g.124475  ORF Transcript_55252/g.124475 Transcript_55252/m.124475 type:complete len:234 (-) Transcript_55252:301-1002(-)